MTRFIRKHPTRRSFHSKHGRLIAAACCAALLSVVVTTANSAGPPPADKCEAAKEKIAGAYYACRAKAEAVAVLKAKAPDYSKCTAKFDAAWDKAETKGGGACPDNVLTAPMNAFVAGQAAETAAIISGAENIPACGDGAINVVGEHCDGSDLGGTSCVSLAYQSGILACNASCKFDASGCSMCPMSDADCDGVANAADNCPVDANPGQQDLDGDGLGTACDPTNSIDVDADGVINSNDNCQSNPNSNQSDTDSDGLGNVCDPTPSTLDNDADGDGIINLNDNCPLDSNFSQTDVDADGLGNVCDAVNDRDVDGDGDLNSADNCAFDANGDQADSDGDGLGDVCDSNG